MKSFLCTGNLGREGALEKGEMKSQLWGAYEVPDVVFDTRRPQFPSSDLLLENIYLFSLPGEGKSAQTIENMLQDGRIKCILRT